LDAAGLVLFMTVGIISPVINLVQALPADVSSCKVFDALSPVCRLPLLLNKFNEFPTSAACISFRLSNVFRENEFLVKAIITKNFFIPLTQNYYLSGLILLLRASGIYSLFYSGKVKPIEAWQKISAVPRSVDSPSSSLLPITIHFAKLSFISSLSCNNKKTKMARSNVLSAANKTLKSYHPTSSLPRVQSYVAHHFLFLRADAPLFLCQIIEAFGSLGSDPAMYRIYVVQPDK
jgi:hypothetical protein